MQTHEKIHHLLDIYLLNCRRAFLFLSYSMSLWSIHNLFCLQAKEIPGIKIFRSSTTIYYTNAEMYMEALQKKVHVCPRIYVFAACASGYKMLSLSTATAPLIAFIISLTRLTFAALSLMLCLAVCAEWNWNWEAAKSKEEATSKGEA